MCFRAMETWLRLTSRGSRLPAVAMDTLPGLGFRATEKTAAAKGTRERRTEKGERAAAGLCIGIKTGANPSRIVQHYPRL